MNDLSTMTKNLRKAVRVIGTLALLVLFVFPAKAQDAKERDVNRIEVKDGKVYVNGEVVKELDDKDLRIQFSKDGGQGVAFFRGNGEGGFENLEIRAPRVLELMNNKPFAVWEGNNFRHAMNDFNISIDMEPLHERVDLIRNGGFGTFMVGSGGNSEIRKLEKKSHELARNIRRAGDGETADLNEELEDLVNQIFDLKLEARQERISKISDDLESLRVQVQERSASRDQIIRRRLSELRGEQDTLDW